MLNKITSVELSSMGKESGSYITFKTVDNVKIGQYVDLDFGKIFHFEICNIKTDDKEFGLLHVVARQSGYDNKINKSDEILIRDLIGYELTIVTDEEYTKDIRKQASYC